MSKKNNDSTFFNDLKNRMHNNADKLKKSENEKNETVTVKTKVEKNDVVNTEHLQKKVEFVEEKKDKPIKKREVTAKAETKVKTKNQAKKSGVDEQEIRRTYYLKKSVVNQVNSMAKRTGNNKSYLVELALGHFLNNQGLIDGLESNSTDVNGFDSAVLIIPDRKDEKKVRRTYYLKKNMSAKLDKVAETKDYDKSFVVEKALEFLFANAKVK